MGFSLASHTCKGIIGTDKNTALGWEQTSLRFSAVEVKLEKKEITSSKVAAATLGAQQHIPVRKFLNQEPMRTDLLAGLAEGRELTLLGELLESKKPVPARYVKVKHNMASATVSTAAVYISQYLTDFSRRIEPLKARRIVISIPRAVGGVHVGYHFACFNTKTKKYLDGPATKELFENLWKDEIKIRLLEKLEQEARLSLSERLTGRDDCQPLDMEIGSIEEKTWPEVVDGLVDYKRPEVWDHNRVWRPFNSDSLLDPKDIYILSSDVGTGKTTFLRHLQLKILKEGNLIPIFVHASKIEQWKPEDIREFAEKFAKRFKLKVHEDKVIGFLEEAFKKDVILLVDGLDQIRGGGGEYQELVEDTILELMDNNVIIASRPSAVINLENKKKFVFLRLKPFDTKTQKLYFGEDYKRARELSVNATDLVAIPMLAYMVRTLIEKKEDKDIRNRAGLYERFIDYILKEYRHGRAELSLGLRTKIRQNLSRISYEALTEEAPFIQKIPLEYCLEQPGRLTMEPEELTKAGLVNLILESSERGNDVLYFTHQSFQEYLAAEWAMKSKERIQNILSEMWNPKWKEVIKFLAGILGEDFIRRLYSLGCKDNCIHSRLFLAAECCGEFYQAFGLEKAIFNQLRGLVSEPTFKQVAIVSVSRLNSLEAVDFLLAIAMDSIAIQMEPRINGVEPLAVRIAKLARTKILPIHIECLISMVETNEEKAHGVAAVLRELNESVTAEHVGRMIDVEFNSRTSRLLFGYTWTYLAEKVLPFHVDRILDLAEDENEDVRLKGIGILIWLTLVGKGKQEWEKRRKPDSILECNEVGNVWLCDVGFRLLPQHIEILINSAEQHGHLVENAVCQIMVNLACKGVLSSCHIDWIIHILTTGSECSQLMILDKAKFFPDWSPSSSVNRIIDLMGGTNLRVQLDSLALLYHCADKLSPSQLTKIISLLDSEQVALKVCALAVLENTKCKLAPEQLDKIIDLLPTKHETLLRTAIHALGSFGKCITREQVDKILNVLSMVDWDPKYTSILEQKHAGIQHSDLCCPISKDLTDDQIKKVSDLLGAPCGFKQKLGIELLVNIGDGLPRTYVRKIVGMLTQDDVSVIEVALRGLQLIHRKLCATDINRIIDCLRSQHSGVREAAEHCLIEAKDVLSQGHIAELVGLLESEEARTANSALAVLAEMPERLPDDTITRIIATLEHQDHLVHIVWREVAEFAGRFGPAHVAKLIDYIRVGKWYLRAMAIKVLAKSEQLVPTGVLYEIIECLLDSNLEYEAGDFLKKISRHLDRQHIERIVEIFESESASSYAGTVICELASQLSVEHIERLVKLLSHQDAGVRARSLDILTHLAERLQPHQIRHVERVFYSPEDQVRTNAYYCLKATYASCGLPL